MAPCKNSCTSFFNQKVVPYFTMCLYAGLGQSQCSRLRECRWQAVHRRWHLLRPERRHLPRPERRHLSRRERGSALARSLPPAERFSPRPTSCPSPATVPSPVPPLHKVLTLFPLLISWPAARPVTQFALVSRRQYIQTLTDTGSSSSRR